jgi:hypothetical protein
LTEGNLWKGLLEQAGYFARRYIELNHQISEWYARTEPALRRAGELAYQALDNFPVWLVLCSVTFSRGGWSEVPLGNMDLGEFSKLVEQLQDKPDKEVRRELDRAILGYFRRDDHAPLSNMVGEWQEHFEDRHHIFEDALWAHKQSRYTLSIHTLAAQVEGIIRDLTKEDGRKPRAWLDRFNDAFGFRYDPKNPPPPPTVEEVVSEYINLPIDERYKKAEELRRNFTLLRINELYDHGEFSDPEFSSSVRRHAILHGVFKNFGELQSLRFFFVLSLLHDAVSEYRKLEAS